MLKLAELTKEDVVYDLGSGDGRIPITAAKLYGARGVGVEINQDLMAEAIANAKQAGVGELVTFRLEDAMETDISDATVVALYVLPLANLKLRPILTKQLTFWGVGAQPLRLRRGSCRLSGHGDRCGCTIST